MKAKLAAAFLILVCLLVFAWKESSVSPVVEADHSANVTQAGSPASVTTQDDKQEAAAAKSDSEEKESFSSLMQRIQALMASGSIDDQQTILYKYLPALVRSNPAMAAGFIDSIAKGEMRDQFMCCVARTWASLDPAAAETWAAQRPDSNERNATLGAVCYQVAEKDPQQAVAVAAQHNLNTAPGAIMEDLVQQWAARDLPSAMEWIKEFPAGEQRDNMYARLALVQSKTAPEEAAEMVVRQIPPGPIQDEAAMSVVHQWATHDMAGATAWVERFPPGAFHDRAEKELAGIAAYQQGH
jgi:hypothetical protein